MPITMEALLEHVQTYSKSQAEILKNNWLNECANLMSDRRDEIEALMPRPQDDKVGSSEITKYIKMKRMARTAE